MTTKVRDIMTTDLFTLRADDSLETLYDAMDLRHIRHVPVVDDDGDLVGLVSQRDLLKGALGDAEALPVSIKRDLLSEIKVSQIMTLDPESVEPSEDLSSAGATLLEYKFGCLPVCENRSLVGIITESDFVKLVIKQNL